MTTLVRARNPLETLKMSQQPASRRRSKRLAGGLRYFLLFGFAIMGGK